MNDICCICICRCANDFTQMKFLTDKVIYIELNALPKLLYIYLINFPHPIPRETTGSVTGGFVYIGDLEFCKKKVFSWQVLRALLKCMLSFCQISACFSHKEAHEAKPLRNLPHKLQDQALASWLISGWWKNVIILRNIKITYTCTSFGSSHPSVFPSFHFWFTLVWIVLFQGHNWQVIYSIFTVPSVTCLYGFPGYMLLHII